MTRLAPDTVIACPACARPVRLRNFRSLNFYGVREWSDGYRSGFLGTRPLITRCDCECIYWVEDAEPLGRYQHEAGTPKRPGFFQRWFSRRKPEPVAEAVPFSWEFAEHARELDLRNMIGVLLEPLAPDREYRLRHTVWHQLNSPDHEDRDAYPHEAELIKDHRLQNLERLLALLDETGKPVGIQRGEILRELGLFEEAIEIFDRIQGESQNLAARLRSEAAQGNPRVVMVVDHGW